MIPLSVALRYVSQNWWATLAVAFVTAPMSTNRSSISLRRNGMPRRVVVEDLRSTSPSANEMIDHGPIRLISGLEP